MGAFDDLVPSSGKALAAPDGKPQRTRRESNAGAFDDLIPGADGVWSADAEQRTDFGAGLREANDPLSTMRNSMQPPAAQPAVDEGVVGNAMRYPKEFGKAIVRGAADLAGTALKFGAAVQTVGARDMQRFVRRQLEVQDLIDRGQAVTPGDDHYGYAAMQPAERQATKQRLASRLAEFDLPGGVQDRDLYKAGEFVSNAGQNAAPAAPGWEDSTTANLGQGVGSVVAGLPVAAGGVGAGALVFGAAGGGEALERAIQHKAAPDDQLKAAILGTGPGVTDVAPIELLLRSNRFTAPFSSQLANAVARIGGNAFVEGIQEGGQQFLQNLIARDVYKPDQHLGEDVLPNTAMGAGVGGITATAVELARLFGGRRGAHSQPQPERRGEVGSATGGSAAAPHLPAGGVGRDWVGDTGRNAMAPGSAPTAPQDGLSGDASGAFDDLIPTRQNGQNPTSDNISFRNLEPSDNGLGPEATPRSWPLPALPDLGLTAKGERLAYGGSGEAPSKRFRHVERTSLQTAAERLTRDVEAYHSELADSGASAADIAKGLADTFGIEATPADIEAGNVWWRVPQRGSIEAPEGFSARRLTDLTEEQRAAIRRLAASGEDTASIARQLGLDATKVGAEVQAAKPRVQRPRSQARALSNIGELYSHHELAGLNAIDAAARLSEVLGRPISPKSIYKARERAAQKGAPLPPMAGRGPGVWSSEALALMERLGANGVKAPAIAATLNEQFPEFGGRLTANAIRVRRSNLARGLTAGGRSKTPDAKALLNQPAFNESAYREAHAELQMLVGDKSKDVSNERYARLISDRFGRHFSPAEVGELRERAREAFRQMTGRQPNFAIGAGAGAFDDLVADAQDIDAAKAAGMWPAGSDQNQQEALNRFRQAMVVAEIASEIESRRLPDLAMTGEVGAANRARAGRPAARDAIEIAKLMDARGASRDDIWQQTADYFRQQDPALIGVFKGADGKWRVEVSDLMAAFVGRATKGGQKLDKVMTDMLRHDELYLTYPDLQRARAGWEIGQKAYARALAKGLPTGMYVSSTRSPDGTEMIAAGAPSTNALLPPIMHETQHGVQQREGFARGSSRGNDVDAYLRQAGEVEARNVEARLAMTDEQRRATPPWDTEDTTASEQIISYFGDRAESYGARRRGGARPINWEAPAVRAEMEGVARRSGGYARTGAIGPMGGARGPDFTWPPAALQMLRENEGKSFSVIARALSDRFGVTITRDMVSGKVRRLRGLSDSDGPLLAASDNPEGWFARFKRGSNAQAGGSSQVRDGLDQTGRKVSGGAPGTSEAPGAGTGRNAAGRASGSVGRFDVGRYAGRVVETPNAHGLRQRRYFLFSPTSEIPGLTHSPGVAVRTLNAMRNWTAKAHVTEVSPGEWRVLKVSVRSNLQRRGVGTSLYDAMNRDLAADLGPSPTMSRKLLQFWRKRDAAAVAAYQRIGNVYHSPAMLRSLKRVNDELLRNPPSARDAAYAKRFASVIDDALANAEDLPQWARSDVTARSFVHEAAKRGEPLSIPKPVVDRMLEGVANAQSRLPNGAEAGVLESVEPIKGRAPGYRGADVVARFRMLDGSTFDVDLPLAQLTRMRAFYDNFTGRIGLTRFGLFGGLDQSIAGEIDHEVVHFLRRQGRLVGATWDRLVRHAHNLRLLDGPLATYLKMVGDPAAHKARPDLTLREAYEGLYRNTTDFAERMDQEAVAHMRELYTHGQLLPQEVAPVRDILDALNGSGELPGVSLDDFAAHADENTDYRDQAAGAFDDVENQYALTAENPKVTTPGGEMEVTVRPEVVDLADLKEATGALQPRDRSRAESAVGVRDRARALDPSRLMPERVSDNGAPLVTASNVVLSGNGRVMSIGEAYRDPVLSDRAAQYRAAVIAYAKREGLGNAVESMRYPVLVSRITDKLSQDELARFADLSNRSAIAEMSSPERAMRDARAVGPQILGLYRGGDFTSTDNREFYRAFMDGAVSANERGSVSRDGLLTKEGDDRMSAAVLAGAYGDPAMLSRMLEATEDNIRSVTGAMRDAAGGFVRLKQAIDAGEVDRAFDITPQLAEAARRIADLRTRKVSLQAFLAQQDAFNRLDPIVEDLLRGFHNDSLTRALSREKLTELLTSYAEEAVKHKQNGLIPDETTPATIVQYATKRAARGFDDFLPGGASSARGPNDRAGAANAGRQPVGDGLGQGTQAVPQGLTPARRSAQGAGFTGGQPTLNAMARLAGRASTAPIGNAMANAIPSLPGIPPTPPPAGMPPAFGGGRGNAAPPPNSATVRALNSWGTSLIETFQNSHERMRILVDRVGQGRLADTEDPYLQSTLYHGRLDARVRFGNEISADIVSSINRLARSSKVSHEAMRELVNDYLVAMHAPERNAIHGDGAAGMTTANARRTVADINARPDGAAIQAIAARVRSLHQMSLDALRGAGVISDELYNRLRNTYSNHVPLNRLVPGQADVMGGIAGRGFDVYSTGIKRAMGSDLEILDVLGNVLSNFEQAMVRSEKNLVDLSSLAFLRRHQADLSGFMQEQRPPVIGTASNGQPLYQQTNDPRVLHLFENGRPLWIRFSDPRLAASFKASNSESLPTVLRWVAVVTRVYSSLATRFNPEFALPNKLRDLQETIIYMGAQRQIGARGAARVLARDPSSTKAILDYLAGRNTVGARLYQEMQNAGGTTGGMGLSTRDSVQLKIEDLDRLAQSSPRRFARRVVELVDNWNTIFEDSTRLSVYRAAREQGLSRQRAAFLAKEASINFNRMGTAGPVVNGLYMFANASIQGSAKMLRSMRNPKVAAAVGVTVAAAIAAASEWNDDVDPQWRDKVSKWDRLNGLPIVLPNENGEGIRYLTIPVSWGVKPIMVAAAAAYDAARGIAVDWATAISDVTTAMVEAYNPLGGTDLVQALTPTVGDTPIDIARNRKWSGGPIRPDQDRNLPYDKQYFLNLKDTKSGRAAIKSTEALHDYTGVELSPADLSYAIEQYIGGTGRSVRKTFDTLIGVSTGSPPPADEFPMLSRFYRERSQEEIGRGAGGRSEEVTARLREQSRQRFDQRSHVDDILRSMEGMTQQERREALRGLRGNRAVFDQVRDGLRMMERGLSWQDKQILRLGIDNGERARFLADEIRSLNADARAARLKELRDKQLVTPEVLQQIRAILAGRRPRLRNPPLDSQSPPVPPPPQRPNAMLPPSNAMSGLSPLPPTEGRNAMMP